MIPEQQKPADPRNSSRIKRRNAAGQSGDNQGLPDSPEANSQSVAELAEEGQSVEAAAVQGVEDASNADESEVKTHEVLEDDVPEEYLDDDRPSSDR